MEHNERLQCSAEGCTRNRHRFSSMCRYHNQINNRWGSPHGHAVDDSHLTYYWDTLEKILKANPNHKGVERAKIWFKTAMAQGNLYRDAPVGSGIQPTRHWAHLYDQQINPRDCLLTAASVWCLGTFCFPYSKDGLVVSDRHLTYLLGFKLIKLVDRAEGGRYMTGTERKKMGLTVQHGIGGLLVNLAETVQKFEEQQQQKASDFDTELAIPATTTITK
jgi:hypothetical protein